MNKKLLSTLIFVVVTISTLVAQKKVTVSTADFKNLTGKWEGTLNYSGTIIRKPFTTNAKLVVKQIAGSNKLQFIHSYDDEPAKNIADTITISKDGKKLNHETIKSKHFNSNGTMEIVTEAAGYDEDNNTTALVKQTYTITKQLYTYKKQVKLKGQKEWLDRQEFKYTKVAAAKN